MTSHNEHGNGPEDMEVDGHESEGPHGQYGFAMPLPIYNMELNLSTRLREKKLSMRVWNKSMGIVQLDQPKGKLRNITGWTNTFVLFSIIYLTRYIQIHV